MTPRSCFFTPFCLHFSHYIITFERFPLPPSGHPIFCNQFSTSSTSVAPIYLYLTPHCLHLLMNIKRGWCGCFRRLTDFKHVAVSTSFQSPSCCCVCLLLFQTASFSAITFPMTIRRLFKWRCRACAYVCARSSSRAPSQYLREPTDKQQLKDVMMTRMENVSYLVLHTCNSSDRSATALKSIWDFSHFS